LLQVPQGSVHEGHTTASPTRPSTQHNRHRYVKHFFAALAAELTSIHAVTVAVKPIQDISHFTDLQIT
jgi:hypothetical protein